MKDLILLNANIITIDDNNPTASSIYIKDGKIEAIGSDDDMKQYIDSNIEVRDMEGKTILPGFVDGHSHLVTTAYDLCMCNLNPSPKGACDSRQAVLDTIAHDIKDMDLSNGKWCLGMGYDVSNYEDKTPITKIDLDKIDKEHPICIIHGSGHFCVMNSKALDVCGIDNNYVCPNGGGMGKIEETGEYNGVLEEMAFFNQGNKIVPPTAEDVLKGIKKANDLYASFGITTAQDAKSTKKELGLIQFAQSQNLISVDLAVYIDHPDCDENLPKQDPRLNKYENHVRKAGYKLFLDGSPQAKTAWLTKPYYIPPEGKDETWCGIESISDDEAYKHMDTCLKNNWQINVHTNGDAAIDQFINTYQKAMDNNPNAMDLRPVSIHCQTVRADQLDKMAKMGMLISFFHDHVYYWGDFHYESTLGPERAQNISPLRWALDRGINITIHQDTPVVNPNIMFAIHNACNRITKGGRPLGIEQCATIQEALKMVTINGAYQLFEEDLKGSLVKGKFGDLVVLDKNPLTVDKTELKDIEVLETIKEGNVIYKK